MAQGGPENIFQWLLGNEPVEEMFLDIEESSFMSTLTLVNVSASSGGEYSCVVSNAAGNDTDSTFLFISPYFTAPPADVEGSTQGNRTVLVCEAEAFPSPEYQWAREDGMEIRQIVTNNSQLVFDPLQFGDEGQYFCNASSGELTIHSDPATLTGASCILLMM